MQPQEAACRLCRTGEMEDMTRLLLVCPAHANHRQKLLSAVNTSLTQISQHYGVNASLAACSADDKVDLLLGGSTGLARADARIDLAVKRFLKKVWRGRKWLAREVNSTFKREDTLWALSAHGDKLGKVCGAPMASAAYRGRSSKPGAAANGA